MGFNKQIEKDMEFLNSDSDSVPMFTHSESQVGREVREIDIGKWMLGHGNDILPGGPLKRLMSQPPWGRVQYGGNRLDEKGLIAKGTWIKKGKWAHTAGPEP